MRKIDKMGAFALGFAMLTTASHALADPPEGAVCEARAATGTAADQGDAAATADVGDEVPGVPLPDAPARATCTCSEAGASCAAGVPSGEPTRRTTQPARPARPAHAGAAADERDAQVDPGHPFEGGAASSFPFQVREERFSRGLIAAGATFIPIGALAMIAGTTGYVAASGNEDVDCYDSYGYGCGDVGVDERGAALSMMGVTLGGVMVVGGIVMTALGAKKVQVLEPKVGSLAPRVDVGAGNASLTWSF